LAPALRAARAEPGFNLKEGSFTAAAGVALRKALVTSQIALALVLLIGAGLFVRTLQSLRAQGPGFATSNLLMFRIEPGKNGYTAAQSRSRMRDLLAALQALPEAQSVALAGAGLLSGGSWNQQLTIESGRRTVSDSVVHLNAVSPGFFGTLGAAFVRGRDFNERDATRDSELRRIQDPAYRSAIVNERFAKRYFADRNPIGARLGLGNGPDTRADIEIVGVVKTFSYRGLRDVDEQAFFPYFEGPINGGGYYVRIRARPQSAFSSIRAAVRQVDSALAITDLRTLDDQLDRTLVNERLLAILASSFAALAILLAMVGIYGVLSFVVSRRIREIGIRCRAGGVARSGRVAHPARRGRYGCGGRCDRASGGLGTRPADRKSTLRSAGYGRGHDRRGSCADYARRARSQRCAGPESHLGQPMEALRYE